jgi:hypothetical protein
MAARDLGTNRKRTTRQEGLSVRLLLSGGVADGHARGGNMSGSPRVRVVAAKRNQGAAISRLKRKYICIFHDSFIAI